jgi:hypothetical protein
MSTSDPTSWRLTDLSERVSPPYLLKLIVGDVFQVRGGMRTVDFKVVEVDPSPYCVRLLLPVEPNLMADCRIRHCYPH